MRLKDKIEKLKSGEKPNISVIYVWFIMYLFLLTVLISASSVVYNHINNLYKGELSGYNELTLKMAMVKVENALNEAQALCFDVAKDRTLLDLLHNTDDDYSANWNVLRLKDYMEQRCNGLSKYILPYVYIKPLDRIVRCDGIGDSESFVYNYYHAGENSYSDWKSRMQEIYQSKYVTLGDDSVNVIQTVPIATKDNTFANVVVRIDFKALFNDDEKVGFGENKKVFLFDKNNELFFCEDDIGKNMRKILIKHLENGASRGVYKDETYQLTSVKSKDFGWKLVVAEPTRLFWSKVNSMNFIFFVFCATCFLLGILIIFLIVKLQYRPLKKLLSSFSHGGEKNVDFKISEYSYIYNRFEDIMLRNTEAEEKLFAQTDMVESFALNKMLDGNNDFLLKKNRHYLNELGFCDDYFTVIVFHIIEYDALFYDVDELSEEKKADRVKLVLMNVAKDIFNDFYHSKITEYSGELVCIVNYKEISSEQLRRDLSERLDKMYSFIKNNFCIEYSTAIGSQTENVNTIEKSYSDAVMLIIFIFIKTLQRQNLHMKISIM